jgi:hypothetical protein
VQRISMLGPPCLMQSERAHSTSSGVSALLSRLVGSARELPLVERRCMQRPIIPRLLGWC